MRTAKLLCGLCLAMAASSALAQGISYNYIEGGFSRVSIDVGPGTVNEPGWNIAGSIDLAQSLYGLASFERWDTGDIEMTRLGGGYIYSVSRDLHWNFDLAWVRSDVRGFGSQNGVVGTAGLRGRLTDEVHYRMRLGGAVNGPDDEGFVAGGHILFPIMPDIDLKLNVETFGFDFNIFSVNFRIRL